MTLFEFLATKPGMTEEQVRKLCCPNLLLSLWDLVEQGNLTLESAKRLNGLHPTQQREQALLELA